MWSDDGAVTAPRLDLMFFSPVRSRILLYIAAVGTTDMITMYDLLGIGSVSALFAVNHWEREGIVRTERIGKHRIVSLDATYLAAKELKDLLLGLVTQSHELRALRRIGRLRMKPILKDLFEPDARLL
jgi:hypothetical protein